MKRFLLAAAIIVGFLNSAISQTIIYVDGSKTTNGNGSAWASAYNNLNDAMKYANETSGKFDIYVATGTYKPNDVTLRGNPYSSDNVSYTQSVEGGFEDNIGLAFAVFDYSQNGNLNTFYPHVETTYYNSSSLGARDVAFSLKGTGIRLFGGFPAGGVGARNIAAYPTYLDGDIGTAGNASDNAYHVMIIGMGVDNFLTTDSIVVDGFTIRNSNANGTGSTRCNGYGVAQNQGGGIYNLFESTSGNTNLVAIRNCTFSNNYAYFGAGVFNESCNATISKCTFSSNTCKSGGGALYINGQAPKILNCTIDNNVSSFFAAGIFLASSTAQINNCSFSSNSTDSSASCIYNLKGGLQLNNCSFTSNISKREAGAIRADNCNMTIAGCTFTSNSSLKNCGAVLSMKSNLSVSNSTFTSNTAIDRGGALWMRGNNTSSGSTFSSCTFQSNTTTNTTDNQQGWGGVILADSSALVNFNNSTFKLNSSKRGGVFLTQLSANLNFNNCLLQSNTSTYSAGVGKNERGSTINFTGSKLISNTCTTTGVEVASWGSPGSILINNAVQGICYMNFNNTLFLSNTVDNSQGSGTVFNFGDLKVKNCVFAKNHTNAFGSAIYNEDGTASVVSSTFYGNTNSQGVSILNAFAGTLTVRNCINNDGYYGYYASPSTATYNAAYSYFDGNQTDIAGTGNVFGGGAGFANTSDLDGADNLWGTNDDGLNISSSSQCKDKGFNSYSTGITADYAGNTRLNGTIDMGAYEWVTVTPANVLTFDGANDYISLPSISVPTNFTYEARIKTSSTATQTILSWGGTDGITFRVENGKLLYAEWTTTNNGANFFSTTTVNDGQWHHVAIAKEGTGANNVKMYIDGVLNATGSSSSVPNTSSTNIGSWYNYAEFFNGQIDEVRIWNRTLCGGEISQNKACELPASNTGLVAYYKFNQGNSGAANAAQTSLVDASGNNRNGTLTNFDLAGTNNWMQASSGVSTTSCGAFTAPTVTVSSNSPAINGGSLTFTAANGFSSYNWSGPNSYSSSLQSPTISNVQTNAAGTYTLTVSQNGCVATTTTTAVVNSNPASALAFDGTDKVVIPYYQLGDEFTIESKFKAGSTGGYNPIVSWTGPNSNSVALMLNSNGTLFMYRQGSYAEYFVGANTQIFNDNQWHHVAVTLFGGTMKVYGDGVLLYSYAATLSTTTNTLTLGEWPGYAAFNGQMDEFRLWNRALCADEISNGKNCEISSSSNGLVIYYKFNQGYHNADNTATTTLTDLAGSDQNGSLTNFSLNGIASNWILTSGTGSITTGTSCTAFNAPNLNSVIGNSLVITNGDITPSTTDNTDFGVVNNAVTTFKNFTITNNGAGVLTISSIAVSGTDASFFTISNAPTTIAANSSAVFKVNFIPAGTTVAKNATITINSNDCRNTPITFAVKATGILLTPSAALNFDGVDDKALASSISLGTDFTLEAKVKFTSTSGLKGLVTLNNGGAFKGIVVNNGYFVYWEQNGAMTSVASSASIADNLWHHVAAVRTSAASNNIMIYVDGVNVGSGTSSLTVNATDLQLGSVFGAYSYAGDMDEVRLWNRALCAAEIANYTNCEISASSTNLYAYYKFNQGNAANDNTTQTSLTDATSNARNAAFAGFALNGAISNFTANGGVVTGSSCSTFQPADIAVQNASAVDIANNDITPSLTDNTDFSDLDINSNPVVTTFTLKNVGTGALNLNGTTKVIVSGTGFSLSQDASATVAATGSTTFKIAFDPNVTGIHTGTVTIYSNDCDESPFTFSIIGNGIGGVPTAAAINFSSAGNNYITANVGSKTVSGNYTVEMWVKPTALQNATLLSTRVPSDGSFDIQLTNTGGLHADIGTGHCFCWLNTTADASVGYTPGTWFHIAYVVKPTGYEIYYNGNKVGSGSYSGTPLLLDNINSTLVLGAHSNANNNFNGDMDEVRIWDRALCGAEIQNNMNKELNGTQNGLVAYYQFNQGQNGGVNTTETTLIDGSGNNLNGTLANFSRTGTTSNWIAPGAVTTGNYASAFIPSEISIVGGGAEIVNADNTPSITDNTDWGNVQASVGSLIKTFTVSNLGVGNLTITGSPRVVVSGTGFSLSGDLSSATISPNTSSTFTINFAPPAAIAYTGTVTIYNNDCDEATYTFTIKGTGFLPAASKALNFDGSNDFVVIPKPVTSDFTIEYWMKTTQVGNTICGQWYCGNGIVDAEVGGVTNDFGTALLGNKLSFGIGNPDVSIQSTSNVNTGEWVLVTATWKQTSGEMKLFINGVLEATGTSGTGLRTAPTRILLGGLQTDTRYFNGSLEEVRIWDRALCEEEINNNKYGCELLNASTGLMANYRFSDGYADAINTGTTALTDYSGNSNTGTLYNFALTGTTSNWSGSSPVTSNYGCAAYSKPVISVSGNSTAIANNDNTPSSADATDFGYTAVGATKNVNFNVANTGTINNLVLSGLSKVTIQGTGFTLSTDAIATIAAGGNSNFTITYMPTTVGTHTGTVTVYSNDCSTPVYVFTIQGSSTPAAALNFVGGDDIINLGTSMNSTLSTLGKLTVEAMVYPTNTTFNGVITGNYSTPNNELQFLLRRDGDRYNFFVNCGTAYQVVSSPASSVVLNTWQHIAGVWDGSELRIYINGILVGTQTGVVGTTLINTVTNYVSIGGNSASFEPFTGSIDELRIWSRDLCITEIQHNMNAELASNQAGLLAYYQFNQGGDLANNSSVTTVTDASGNGYNGTIVNMALTGSTSNWIAPGAITSGTTNGTYFPAEIEVNGNSIEIVSNDNTPSLTDDTDFGSVLHTSTNNITKTFTIRNAGNKVLNLSGSPRVTLAGTDFTLLTDAPATINPGTSATFQIVFDPSTVGISTATVSVNNDDCDEALYTFDIKGEGRNADPANALHFDGVDDYVSVANPYYQYNKAITVEWHVNIENSQMGSGIGQGTSNVDNPSTNVWLMHLMPDKSIYFGVNNNVQGSGNAYTQTLSNGWHHIVGVATPQFTKLYIDGQLVNTAPGYAGTSITNNSASEIQFGKDVRYSNGRFFQGKMDEVRIWNRVLTAAEINQFSSCERNVDVQNPKGLVGYYKFDQGLEQSDNTAITTVMDSSTYAKHGTLNNFALTGTTSNFVLGSPITTGNYCTPCTVSNSTLTVNQCSSAQYVSPSGLYTWTADGTYQDTLTTTLGCDSIITVNLTFNDLSETITYNPTSVAFCGPGQSTQFEVVASQSGTVYELLNMADSSSLAVLGGGLMQFNTGAVNATSAYGIRVSKNGCSLILNQQFVATVKQLPNTGIIIDRTTLASEEINGTYNWLDCANANSIIAGQTQSTYVPASAGNYAVEVTSSGGCIDTSVCIAFVPPVPAAALNFDGVDDFVNVDYVLPTTNFTMELWFKSNSSTGGLMEANGGGYDRSITLINGNISTYIWPQGANGIITTSGTNYADGNWHHVAYAVGAAAGGQKLYVDGQLRGSASATYSGFNWNTSTLIGFSSYNSPGYFNGSIDEVRVWERVLTQEQIINKMNCSVNDDLTGLGLNYNFNQGDSAGYNQLENILITSTPNNKHGHLNNFALTGSTSNWIAPGAMTNNTVCQSCVTNTTTINASTCGEAYVSPSGNYTWTVSGTYVDTLFSAYSCDSIIIVHLTNNGIDTATTRSGNILLAAQPNATYQWLDCGNGSIGIANEIGQAFSPLTAGNYAVEITRGSCIDTSFCINYSPLPPFILEDCIPTVGGNDMFRSVVSDDFNGDGYKDLMGRDDWGITHYYTNDGNGNFSAGVDLFPAGSYYSLASHDLDNDGDVDLVVYNSTINANIYINDGTGTFTLLPGVNLMNGTGSINVLEFGDVNADGNIDIITGNNNFSLATDMNEVWINTGSVGNASFTYLSGVQNINGGRNSLDLGDIDGDGDNDLVTGGVSWTGYVYKNDGSGAFTLSQTFNEYSGGIRFLDWDNDGDLDKVNYDNYNTYGLRVSLNDGIGNFNFPSTQIITSSTSNNCVVADLNGDNNLDLVFDSWGGNGIVYLNTGCNFVLQTDAITSNASHGIDVDDFNNDGKPDVFCLGRTANSCFHYNNLATATSMPSASVTSVLADSSCGAGILTLSAVASNNGGLNWYNAANGGSILGTGNVYVTGNLSAPATYYVEAVNALGCTSQRVPVLASIYADPTISIAGNPNSVICPGESVTLSASGASIYVWNNGITDNTPFNTFATATYQVTGTDVHGCSNTASATVNVSSTSSNTINQAICEGASLAVGANSYNATGVYYVTLANVSGCDSLVVLNLTVNNIDTVDVTTSICSGDEYIVGTTSYNTGGMHYTTFQNVNGCDSIVALNLTVNNLPTVSFALTSDIVCNTSGSLALSATPAGGTYSGVGVSGSSFDPQSITVAGYVYITYTSTNGNGCSNSSTDSVWVDICTGIATSNLPLVGLYPNPAIDKIEVITSTLTEQPIEILNALGQQVYLSTISAKKIIDMSNLADGIYTVKVGEPGKALYRKVVKQ